MTNDATDNRGSIHTGDVTNASTIAIGQGATASVTTIYQWAREQWTQALQI